MADDSRRRYIDFLPAVFRRDRGGGEAAFLDAYLAIFQTLLDRNPAAAGATTPAMHRRGMAEVIDVLPQLLDPRLSFLFPGDDAFIPPIEPANLSSPGDADQVFAALNDYVGAADPPPGKGWQQAVDQAATDWLDGLFDWLAAWVGLTCDDRWSLDRKRAVIATILPLYRQRGTAAGLQALLRTFIDAEIVVRDAAVAPPLVVGHTTALAEVYSAGDPVVGGVRPFTFGIALIVPTYDVEQPQVQALVAAIRSLADREKPAHTDYVITVETSLTRLGTNSIVGKSFLIPKESRQR